MSLDSGSQIITSEPATVPNAGLSFHRASIHFAASLRLLHRSKPYAG